MKAIKARFDGRVIVPEEPLDLPANTQVRVLIPESQNSAELVRAFSKLSESSFARLWDNEEDAAYDNL